MPNLSAFKPDFPEAARRWRAFHAGEIVDRPLLIRTIPKPDRRPPPPLTHRGRFNAAPEAIVDRHMEQVESTLYLGEAIPAFSLTFGCDELAMFCGAPDLSFHPDSENTCWGTPCVDDWEQALPIRFNERHPLWLKMLATFRLARERFAGRVAMGMLDTHSNMDMLAALRGSRALCEDCLDTPELVDAAMESARKVFPVFWSAIREAGGHDEVGYCHCWLYAPDGACMLQCDFSCMISPAMFDRWVAPALAEEAALVRHAIYHWDGVGALVHEKSVLGIPGLATLGFVPGAGAAPQSAFVDRYIEWQKAGRAVHVGGTVEECRAMHKVFKPDLSIYTPFVETEDEFNRVAEWFVRNT